MNSKKQKAINALAESLIDTLDLKVPIPVQDVPGMLGGYLTIEKFSNDELEAMIQKVGTSFVIQISPAKHYHRRRFSIAHEIGHLFLHMGFLINPDKWENVSDYRDSVFYRLGHNIEEREANEFAGAFLMPRQEFEYIAHNNLENGYFNIPKIANHFDVSEEAVSVRGKLLGLFRSDLVWNQ